MHFRPALADIHLPVLIPAFIRIVGHQRLQARFDWLEREVRENEHMESWLRQRCALEWTMRDLLASGRLETERPLRVGTVQEYELFAFLAGLLGIYRRLSPAGQARLQGRLADGLHSDQGLLAIQHEVTTAIHLMSRGFDVECTDLEHGGGFDFLARGHGTEIEVECKMASGDIGRKIHMRKALILIKHLDEAISTAYASADVGLIVRVTVPDRLSGTRADHDRINDAVRAGMLCGTAEYATDVCTVRVLDFPITGSPFDIATHEELSLRDVREFAARLTGQSNTHLIARYHPRKRAVVLMIDSAKPDQVLDRVRSVLRMSALNQFTKSRPGYLVVQLHDISEDQLVDLAASDSSTRGSATGLQAMTSDLLQSDSRAHIHSVVYRAHGTLTRRGNAVTAEGTAYYVPNAYHPFARDPRYSVFRDAGKASTRIFIPG